MNIVAQALSGAGWLASFKILSQTCSWLATIIVTRMLTSEDYGLMEIATIFTGYVSLFVEFGIGSALINKDKIEHKELSTAFWFSICWGALLSVSCFILAPVTAQYYAEPRVYSLTQGASIVFILGSFAIVPRALLQKELRFKELAIIEFITILSCILMITLAAKGFGPWTLLGGLIGREAMRCILFYKHSRFTPSFVFSKKLLLPLVTFGTPVMLSSSLYYIYTKADRFFGGTSFGAEELGYYALALQLAAIPVEKIVSLLQGVLFPTLSKLKHDQKSFNKIYLSFISALALITFPLFIGGGLIAEDLVIVLLGEKWRAASAPLQILLIAQLYIAITAPNSLIHAARGKPAWNFVFNACLAPVMVLSFYLSSQLSPLYKLAIPWISVFPMMQLIFVSLSNKQLGISGREYIASMKHPACACVLMGLLILGLHRGWPGDTETVLFVLSSIAIGATSYSLYLVTIGKKLLSELKALKHMQT